MKELSMPTAYDTWKEGNCGINDAESLREEWVSDKAARIASEYLSDQERVQSALSEFFTIESGNELERALARFYLAVDGAGWNEDMAQAALDLFDSLRPTVEARIRADAESDAEAEYERFQADMDEARESSRDAA